MNTAEQFKTNVIAGMQSKLEIEQANSFNGAPYTHNNVFMQQKNDFLLIYGEIYNEANEFRMKRYFLYIYDIFNLEFIYKDSNVCDFDKNYSFEDILKNYNNKVKYTLEKINK